MEYPWQHHPPPPPPPGNHNLCPTCSFSHFPFCAQFPHHQNPSFQFPATYSPQTPQITHNQNPNPDHRNYDYGIAYSPFDRGYMRPRSNELGVGGNQNPSLDNRNYNDGVVYSSFDHGYMRPRPDELGVGDNQKPSFQSHAMYSHYRPQIVHNQNPSLEHGSNYDGVAYVPIDRGYKRPRPGELDVGDNERRLKLIHDHGGNDLLFVNGESRGYFPENLGFKFPRFDELGVGNNCTNTNNEISEVRDPRYCGFHAESDFSGLRYGEEPSLPSNFRGNYDQKQGRDDFYSKSYAMRSKMPPNHDIHSCVHLDESAFGHHVLPTSSQVSPQNSRAFDNTNAGVGRGINVQPPPPVASPTPIVMDPQISLLSDLHTPSSQVKAPSLFPISVTPTAPMVSSYASFAEAHGLAQPSFQDKSHTHVSTGFAAKEFQPVSQSFSMNYAREGHPFPLIPSNKPKAVDASLIFKQPHRATRPDHIVVILRGLPGSGKSYLAKMMRDLEVENGGNAPRIHSMDDYFMMEVEKVEESDNLKSSGSSRGKKPVVKMVMEYCYEAEMEEAYRASMLKTFKKTLDDGAFPFVIVDDRNLRVADFAQFWATAKTSGYEVYLLETTYKDPAGCAARNVHGFTLDDIQKMAYQWEEAPSLYLKLDTKSLLQGDDLKENGIQEVDMDTEDGQSEDALDGSVERNYDISAPAAKHLSPSGPSNADDSWNAERERLREEVKELGRSKWSNDLEDDDVNRKETSEGNSNAPSALVKSYRKGGKSVYWGDQAANTGFSIGAAKRVNTSLVIGPGSGYNSKSNPLREYLASPGNSGKSKTQSVFQERIRAERESFRAVFDKRRHRIGGLGLEEE